MAFFGGITRSRDVPIFTTPHYTDKRFDKEQTVFGQEREGLFYNYSDRIWQWDYDKAEASVDVANNSGHVTKSAKWYEVYLSTFHDRPVTLHHVVAGVNKSNGYPYAVFGYTFDDAAQHDASAAGQ